MSSVPRPGFEVTTLATNLEDIGERFGRGVAASVLLHLLFLALGWYAAPTLGTLLAPLQGRERPREETPVVTFRMSDIVADVAAASRVDAPPPTEILGRHNSRAADRVPGDEDTPVPAGGEVGLDNSIPGSGAAEESAGAPGDGAASTPPSTAPPSDAPSEEGLRPGLRDALPTSTDQLLSGRREPSTRPGYGARRSSDFDAAGALAFGEYAFSTRAWDYEPYWVHMRAKLYGAWIAPAAYQYGIIPGGWTLVRVTVHKDGSISDAQVLQTDGHESLHRASLAAMEGAAPFRPLPADFPDETLVVTVRFVYLPPGAAPARNAP